jgi:triacylglycerol lipase
MEKSLIRDSILFCQLAYQTQIPDIYDRQYDVQGIYKDLDNTLTIAFRGSTSLQDWINNFKLNKLEYPWSGVTNSGVKLHAGFTDAYKSIRIQLRTLVAQYQKTHQIVFTGHSQGGAIALIAALDCQYNFQINPDVVTYGQPKVGNLAFCKSVNSRLDNYFRVVNHYDPVPWIPQAQEKYSHCGKEVKRSLLTFNPHHINAYRKAINLENA